MSDKQAKRMKKLALEACSKEMNSRLDSIEDYVKKQLEEQNKRAKNIQSFIMQHVTGKIQNDLFNANVTIDSVVEVLAEAGLNIENFAQKVDAKKSEISKRRVQEAEDKMKASLEKQNAAQQPAADSEKTDQKDQQAPLEDSKPPESSAPPEAPTSNE